MKKCTRLFLTLCMVCVLVSSVPAYAQDLPVGQRHVPFTIAPRWENAATVTATLSFPSGKASCYAYIKGKAGTEAISATVYLEREFSDGSRELVDSWDASTSSASLTISKSCAVTKGYSYVLSVDGIVTRYGTDESVYQERTGRY